MCDNLSIHAAKRRGYPVNTKEASWLRKTLYAQWSSRRATNGTTYYFCSMDCKEEFDENPEDYAD